ncbi:TPA: hypothetical protein QB409_002105, partial [Pasteurella multocida]|nr:hypothetical protein [Pasteurella multocida]
LNSVQYNKLLSLGEGKGFDDSYYNVATHNCVSYVFKALHVIGYNPQDINMGTRLTDWILSNPVSSALAYSNMGFLVNAVVWQTINGAPSLIYDDLTQLLAANGAIAVEGNRLFPVPGNTLNVNNKIIGYSNIDDVIIGGIGDDHLIGKDGNDILIGDKILPKVEVGLISDEDLLERVLNKGKDILEGGEGYDTYYVNHGDIIIDSDGKGEIRFQDIEFNYFVGDEQVGYFGRITEIRGDSAEFTGNGSDGMAYSYLLNGLSFDGENFSAASLIMTNLETKHQITIRNFTNGQLNIYLNDLIHFDGEMSVIQYYFEKGENLFNTYDVDPDGSGYNWARLKHGSYRSEATDLDSHRDNNSNGNGSNGGSNGGGSNGGGSNGGRGSPNQRGRSPQLYDPLVLDLDGDGIETVGHNGHSGSLFDHDADGIRTSTGWIK